MPHLHQEPSGWYIELPEYIAQGGNKGDLEMVDGADIMLDIMAAGRPVPYMFDDKAFEDADKVILLENVILISGGE